MDEWIPGNGWYSETSVSGDFTTQSGGSGGGSGGEVDFTFTYTTTDITFTVTGGSGYYIRYFVRLLDGTLVYDTDYPTPRRQRFYRDTFTHEIAGILEPGTTYVCNVGYSDYSDGDVTWVYRSDPPEFTTPSSGGGGGGSSVAPFSWSESNGSASAYQTSAAYSAVTSHGETSDFSYLVWNDIVDKIMEALDALNWRWITPEAYATLSYTQTRMTSSDRTMTAARFRSAVCQLAINNNYTSMNYDDYNVQTGDTVYGRYFTDLVYYLNQMISNL